MLDRGNISEELADQLEAKEPSPESKGEAAKAGWSSKVEDVDSEQLAAVGEDTHASVAKSTALMSAATLISRVTGLVRTDRKSVV